MAVAAVDSRLGFLLQLRAVSVQHLIGIVVRGEEADIVHLSPALLLGAQEGVPAAQQRLEGRRSKGRHLDAAAL